MFDSHGHFINPDAEVESGPLRTSEASDSEIVLFGPPWACLDHGPRSYTTHADHRAISGRIVRRGTACLAERRDQKLYLDCDSGETVVLDGARFVLLLRDLPRLPAEEYAFLFLAA